MEEVEKDSDHQEDDNTDAKELSVEEVDKRLAEFKEQSPLLETLQRELSSAQDAINALTNQNSELRTDVMQLSSSENTHKNVECNKTQVLYTFASGVLSSQRYSLHTLCA